MNPRRYELSDFEWSIIQPLLPDKPRGVPRADDRKVLNGIYWRLRTGSPWADIPERYGPPTTCANRFRRWAKIGVWDRIFEAVSKAYDGDLQMIDASSIRVHQHGGNVKKMLWGGRRGLGTIDAAKQPMEGPMSQVDDLSRSLTAFDQDSTLIAVIEMSLKSWLVAGIVPGVGRAPLKKLEADEAGVLRQLHRWRDEATKAGHPIKRLVVAFEAGRDGFWLARWLRTRGVEAHVIHSASVAVSREHRRAKTDRLDTEMLKRAFLGWLRGEAEHCQMAAVPTLAEEDARRPNRERDCLVRERTRIVNRMKGALVRLGIRGFNPKLRQAAERLDGLVTPQGEALPPNTRAELQRDLARLVLLREQIKAIEAARLSRLEQQASSEGPHAMVRLLAQVVGIGIETADMLVHEILSRNLRDQKALARYAGLTGSPDESGNRRREKGLARAGNGRVRRGMIQLAWRFLRFQDNSALAKWYAVRTEAAPNTRKTMIVALARKLLIALWRFATMGMIPDGVALRAVA